MTLAIYLVEKISLPYVENASSVKLLNMAKVYNLIKIIPSLFALIIGINISAAKLPDYIMVCRANVTDMNKCVTDTVNFLRPKLKTGIPELKVPSLEPLHIPRIELTKGIRANITDILVHGPSDFEVLEMKVNVPKNKFVFRVNMPSLIFNGKYQMNTRLLLLQIVGEGPIHGNFTNYTFRAALKGHRSEGPDGEVYLQFSRLNQIINEANESIVEEIKPALEDALELLFTEVANKVVSSYPHKELFPV